MVKNLTGASTWRCAHRGGKETLGRRALYERIMADAANGHRVTKDLRNFYGLDLAEQPRAEPW